MGRGDDRGVDPPLCRAYLRLLRTDKERVGVVERWVRRLPLVPPYYGVVALLRIRAALRGR